jgi:hypothetical protein
MNRKISFAYHQIYFCDPFKTIEQIEDFIIRAISDPEQRWYYLVDTHLLSPEKFDELIQIAQKYFNEKTKLRNGNLCLMTINENDTGVNNLMSYASKNRESFVGEAISEIASPKYNALGWKDQKFSCEE